MDSPSCGPCVCREAPVEQVVYSADVICLGTVRAIRAAHDQAQARVEFRAFEVIKSDVKGCITLHTTAFSDADCLGFASEEGRSYLLFAAAQHSRTALGNGVPVPASLTVSVTFSR